MNILITNGTWRLSQDLAASLSGEHDVVLTDRTQVPTRQRFVQSDLGHSEGTDALVKGTDVIVHSGWSQPDAAVSKQLDAAMRCTYNVLWAAAEGGVPRLIYLSSLSVLDGYDEELAVTERWRPVPTTDPAALCYHLGEYVCREFAREKKIEVVCLRMGEIAWDAEQAEAASSSALFPDDAIQAVEKALAAEFPLDSWGVRSSWNVYHIQSDVPGGRYLTAAARSVLGYEPRQGA